jgi:hypothetical protein
MKAIEGDIILVFSLVPRMTHFSKVDCQWPNLSADGSRLETFNMRGGADPSCSYRQRCGSVG